ncbi:MAG: nucleotidyltransferase domain-containing protein [Candidatus Bathyarchaeota archaeon]|nr:MAG: nucleotidyltransferase domain-containing protein [Candidatus Bathyarchaeota archaeon]
MKNLRKRAAREAATLLYTLQEKEYKQAKMRAAETLRVRTLPSNLDVALELDRIADEMEGASRWGMLLQMRKEALEIMRRLGGFHPRLVGSVWRGTAHRNSDIDILTFSSDPSAVLKKLKAGGLRIVAAERASVTKKGKRKSSFHIYIVLPSGNKAEVVIRDPERQGAVERCEIYGDSVTGLDYSRLKKVLEEDPHQRFLPK